MKRKSLKEVTRELLSFVPFPLRHEDRFKAEAHSEIDRFTVTLHFGCSYSRKSLFDPVLDADTGEEAQNVDTLAGLAGSGGLFVGLGGEGALRLGFRLGEGDGAVSRDAKLNLVAAREIQEIADFLRNSDLTLDSKTICHFFLPFRFTRIKKDRAAILFAALSKLNLCSAELIFLTGVQNETP